LVKFVLAIAGGEYLDKIYLSGSYNADAPETNWKWVGTNSGKKFLLQCPPPVWGTLHTTGWAQRWAVIAHCLFVKKWPKNLVF